MTDDAVPAARYRMGAGTLVVSCVFAFLVGGAAGLITTFTHAQLPPWGLVAGLAIAAALVLGFRLVFDSRVVAAVAGGGFVAGTVLLNIPTGGAPILALDGWTGWLWAVGPAVLALAAALPRWPERPSRRP